MFLASVRSFVPRVAAVLIAGLLAAVSASAQVSLGGGTYTQNFDAATAAVPPGWLFAESGTNANTSFSTGTGSSNAGDTYFLGSGGEWAFGGLLSGSLTPTVGVAFTNTTGGTITALAISYTGETWRVGGTNRSDRLDFQYSTNATSLTTGTWTDFDALDYSNVAQAATASGSMLQSANLSATISGLSIPSGATFYLRWNDFNAAGSDDAMGVDNFSITATSSGGGPIPPSITTPPASHTVMEGTASVQFTVVAAGDAPLAYQWRKGGAPLSDNGHVTGALTSTLTIANVALTDAGSYDVVVSNAAPTSATSAAATLTVNSLLVAPSITTQPAPQSVAAGTDASFTVAASGTAPLAYQWRKDGAPLANGSKFTGVDTPTLTVHAVAAEDTGSFDVVVSNGVNPDATSNAVPLSLAPMVTPAGQVAYVGGSYGQSFDTLPASGTFTLTSNGPLGLDAAPINASGLGGWSLAKYGGSGTVALFRVDAGTSTSGSIYSYGTGSTSDRALGSLSSGTTVPRFGFSVVNSTGVTINAVTISYTGEQWRRGSAAANKLTFEYAVDATDINTGDFVAAPSLDFTAPIATGSAGALDGNAPANRAAVSATVSGLTWAPGQTLVLRWTDVDDSGGDDGLAIDNFSLTTSVTPGATIPSVVYVTPAPNKVNVATNSSLTVAFNKAVTVDASSFVLAGSSSGGHAVTVSGGPLTYTLTPITPFDEGEDVTFTVLATGVTDAATGTQHPGADYQSSFVTFSSGPLPIHTIQGSGLASAYAGQTVTLSGVVVASYQGAGQIGGYYVEAPDAEQDANAATSEGIYVFDNTNAVAVGDRVTVTGTISEYGTPAAASQTELSSLTAFTKVSSGNALPTPVSITLPFATSTTAERYEGMLVTFPQTLTVTDNYDLGHFGEVILSNGRLPTPTNIVAPGAAAQAQEAANLRNQVTLDDGLSTTNPSPTPYLNSADPTLATRRTGSTTTGVTGILDNKFGLYVVEPTQVPTFVDANPRQHSPASVGSLRVAIGNVENLMNGNGAGGGFPTSRGASSYAEYQRQLPKVTAAILNLAPDIMGLTEVENDRMESGEADSYGPTSMIAQLVASLNASAPAGTTYAFVNAAPVDITTDVIHVALIYRTETVEEVGTPAMLNDPAFNNLARNPLAQTFRQKSTGSKLTVCINHFRAKGGAAAGAGNTDSGDGQGTNNALRVQEAQAVTAWLATSPTGDSDPDVLIIGDLNAYAKEDPIAVIENAGYTNLSELYEGEGGYSYAFNGEFGHLDHALATASLTAQVRSTATWHANADEPVFYDYNVEDKDAAQQAINAGTPYRYADHDPVVIGIELDAAPLVVNAPLTQTVTVGTSVTFTVNASGSPAPTYQWRKDGVAITGATGTSYTIAFPTSADAGSYDVVVTNGLGSVTSSAAVLTVTAATGSVTLGGLDAVYDGQPHAATATTSPGGLPVTITYNGSATPPKAPGWYNVVATINSPDYTGSATGLLFIDVTALVRHLPTLDGKVKGSVQVVTAEGITLNGNAGITGDLLVVGSPKIRQNGKPAYAGTLDGTGAATPASATVTLNGGASLRNVVRRTDAQVIASVSAPPAPTGTRSVSINSAGQSAGDFATLRNLTLNSNAGQMTVPAGTYGAFTANGTSSFVFGVAGATNPAVYNLQSLTINGSSKLIIAGPVTINLAGGIALNGSVDAAGHAEWLQLNVASGGVTLNGNVSFTGFVTAPAGTVTINGNSTLTGRVIADRLTVNGSGMLIDPQ